ncbi:hypothetical protein [Mongoliitalea lutea]|uniref:Uncharacterized protein n=1 Tax=Mongoliitalea lutea TaxID=849756 RepID=A0A8J3G503_9BACT|nr:hypothetical protein [Mongoliitalea lutea]GHB34478.1 hypothetical protein GCM10008106_14820 [Mongoliitalea lutea]
MKLNKDQIEQLHYHINTKQIPYIEVRDEVLDHYQTALELEQERPVKEVLAELDQTFTVGYCKQLSGNYLNELHSAYPEVFKKKLVDLLIGKNWWVAVLLLAFSFSLPSWVDKARNLQFFITISILFSTVLVSWTIDRAYPKRKIKHQYRLVDDKPILAMYHVGKPRGIALIVALMLLLVALPILILSTLEFFTEHSIVFLFQAPYVYFTVGLIWLFFIAIIARAQAIISMTKAYTPKLNCGIR